MRFSFLDCSGYISSVENHTKLHENVDCPTVSDLPHLYPVTIVAIESPIDIFFPPVGQVLNPWINCSIQFCGTHHYIYQLSIRSVDTGLKASKVLESIERKLIWLIYTVNTTSSTEYICIAMQTQKVDLVHVHKTFDISSFRSVSYSG